MQLMVITSPRESVQLPGGAFGASVSLAGVNWDQEIAVVVDMGEQRTAGYAVEVVDTDYSGGDSVDLTLRVVRPGPGDFVAQVLTHPHTVARLQRRLLRPGEITVAARDANGKLLAQQVVTL